MDNSKVIEAFWYILHRIYDKVTYADAVIFYNRLVEEYKYSDSQKEKIIELANLLKTKENVVNE